MRVLGIDPSSSCVGLALVVDGELAYTRIWKPSKPKDTHANKLKEYEGWLKFQVKLANPDIAAVEQLNYATRRIDVVRVISYYEGVSLLVCAKRVAIVKSIMVSTARAHTLGKGNLSKEDSFKQVKRLFPKHKFRHFDQGGGDESDAAILAIAAPSVAEQ